MISLYEKAELMNINELMLMFHSDLTLRVKMIIEYYIAELICNTCTWKSRFNLLHLCKAQIQFQCGQNETFSQFSINNCSFWILSSERWNDEGNQIADDMRCLWAPPVWQLANWNFTPEVKTFRLLHAERLFLASAHLQCFPAGLMPLWAQDCASRCF